VRDPLDFLAVHQIVIAPPAFEVEKAGRCGIDVVKEVIVLVPQRIRRIKALEVLHQMSAVEFSGSEIRGK